MSMAARCPQCSTTFRIVPDQLKISDGWVRCGQCKHVFDAYKFQSEPAPKIEPSPSADLLTEEKVAENKQQASSTPIFGDTVFEDSLLSEFHISWADTVVSPSKTESTSSSLDVSDDNFNINLESEIAAFAQTIAQSKASKEKVQEPDEDELIWLVSSSGDESAGGFHSTLFQDDAEQSTIGESEPFDKKQQILGDGGTEIEPLVTEKESILFSESLFMLGEEPKVTPISSSPIDSAWMESKWLDDKSDSRYIQTKSTNTSEKIPPSASAAPSFDSNTHSSLNIPKETEGLSKQEVSSTKAAATSKTPASPEAEQKKKKTYISLSGQELTLEETFVDKTDFSSNIATPEVGDKSSSKKVTSSLAALSEIEEEELIHSNSANEKYQRIASSLEDQVISNLSFINEKREDTIWRKPIVKFTCFTLGLILLLALILQMTYIYRVKIAAQFPNLRPLLTSLCQPIGCTVGYPIDLSTMKLEASSLDYSDKEDYYILEITIRNTNTMVAAVPWVELTLTNTSGATIVRKAFSPDELGITKEFLKPSEELVMRKEIKVNSPEARTKDYSTILFYP